MENYIPANRAGRIVLALLAATLITLVAAAPVFCKPLVIEAENFTHNENIRHKPFQSVEESGCKGGKMLIGLDYPQEWVAYELKVESAGTYGIRFFARADSGQRIKLRLTLAPDIGGEPRSANISYTGRGYG